jgi:hypothetical protein
MGKRISMPSPAMIIGFVALVVALSGTAYAATASLVTIQGAGSHHQVHVDKSGQLSVNAGTKTGAGQLLTAEASPSDFVRVLSTSDCTSPFYTPPAGKALIITALDFYVLPNTPNGDGQVLLEEGPPAHPCQDGILAAEASDVDDSQNQVFQPGIAVPAGEALAVDNVANDGSVEVYGYLVPAADVPSTAVTKHPAMSLRSH